MQVRVCEVIRMGGRRKGEEPLERNEKRVIAVIYQHGSATMHRSSKMGVPLSNGQAGNQLVVGEGSSRGPSWGPRRVRSLSEGAVECGRMRQLNKNTVAAAVRHSMERNTTTMAEIETKKKPRRRYWRRADSPLTSTGGAHSPLNCGGIISPRRLIH